MKRLAPLALMLAFVFCNTVALASANDGYVGSAQCSSCHEREYTDWLGSNHEMAMRHATPKSVKAVFDNQPLTFRGLEHRFYKKGDRYWLAIHNDSENIVRYEIKYTFGVEPLQQYMVEFEDGRVQLLPFAWDSRPKTEGGQRWFDLYPEHTEPHQLFYWKNIGQNWNFMCADCHSTNVKKNFDIETNSYATTYSEISVGCEACHGPAKEHLLWATGNASDPQAKKVDSEAGFSRDISKPVANWNFSQDHKIAVPTAMQATDQVAVCTQCHSRRAQISDAEDTNAGVIGDRYRLNLLEVQHYYPDGQVYDENYVAGSFMQSKMHEQGVACTNCHNPHSAKLIAPQESICLQCHKSEAYDTPAHHHHIVGASGSRCVDCHMPQTTYMTIDHRRDHRFHIPNPVMAEKTQSPDTCLSCHEDRDSQWSAKALHGWGIKNTVTESDFSPVFSAAREGYIEAEGPLSHIAQNEGHASIVRAGALERLAPFETTNTLIAVARGVKNESEVIRLGAVNGAANIPLKERWRILSPLLTDEVLVVRAEAAKILMPLWSNYTVEQKKALKPALDEYIAIQVFNGDRGSAHNNRGNMLVYQGLLAEAEAAYRQGFTVEPYFANNAINLADLYRQQNKNKAGIDVLKQSAISNPDSAPLAYSLGLAFIREKQTVDANRWLKKATVLMPDNSRYWYVYSLAVESINPVQGQAAMAQAYQVSGNPQHLYSLCEMYIRHQSPIVAQCLSQLEAVAPVEAVNQLKNQLH